MNQKLNSKFTWTLCLSKQHFFSDFLKRRMTLNRVQNSFLQRFSHVFAMQNDSICSKNWFSQQEAIFGKNSHKKSFPQNSLEDSFFQPPPSPSYLIFESNLTLFVWESSIFMARLSSINPQPVTPLYVRAQDW